MYSQLPLYRSRRDLNFSFDMTEFYYKGSNISAIKALGERIHFDKRSFRYNKVRYRGSLLYV